MRKTKYTLLSLLSLIYLQSCTSEEKKQEPKAEVGNEVVTNETILNNFENKKAKELNDKGQKAAEESNFLEADKLFKEALKLEPNNPVILNNLGFTAHSLEHSSEANEYYVKAIELDSSYLKTFANYSLFLYENGDYKKATQIAEFGIEHTEDNEIMGLCFYHATLSLNQLNECLKAKEYYEKFIALFSEDQRFVASYEHLKQEMVKCL